MGSVGTIAAVGVLGHHFVFRVVHTNCVKKSKEKQHNVAKVSWISTEK